MLAIWCLVPLLLLNSAWMFGSCWFAYCWSLSWKMFSNTHPFASYCKIQALLGKGGKTTRPLRYDLNQISYDYTVEVTNRFKRLDLVDRVTEELWTEVCNDYRSQWPKPLWTKVHNIAQESVTKIIPKKNKCKKAKCLFEALHMAKERREAKSKGERERYTQLNAEVQRIARTDEKAFIFFFFWEDLLKCTMRRSKGKQ